MTGNTITYYGYDNNGNQVSEWTRVSNTFGTNEEVDLSFGLQNEATDNFLTLYGYDSFDRLVKIEQGADVIENVYTADGKKLSRTTNGEVTYYVYDGNAVIEEQNSENEESARNVYGRNLITREDDSNKIVYGFNGHGDVVYQADIDGTVLETYNYDEFGNPAETAFYLIQLREPEIIEVEDEQEKPVSIRNPYRYAGYEYIEEVGLYDLSARYYNPETARFISADPYYNLGNRVIGLYEINVPTAASIMQANNIYVYCGNNPLIYIDENGEVFFLVTGAIGAVAGGIGGAIYSQVKYGKVRWQNVVAGAAIGGAIGATGGAAAAYVATGSAVASTTAVATSIGGTAILTVGTGSALGAKQIKDMISNVIPNKVHHIMLTKHAWNLVNATSWSDVSKLINTVLIKGTGVKNDFGNTVYSYVINRQTVEVTTRVVDGVTRIVDAWVKTR